MTNGRKPALKPGALLGGGRLVVMHDISTRGEGGVYAVWNRDAWCVMACKTAASMSRALQEGSVLQSMAHPGIVGFCGILEPGLILMPFLEGQTLSALFKAAPRGRLSISDAARIGVQVGGALGHVHDRGFLHLGVEPGNVLVGGGGDPVLCDFGSARSIGSRRSASALTPSPYMAPEEYGPGDSGRAADVYSLGVCIYELLTGHLPHRDGPPGQPQPQMRADAVSARRLRLSIPSPLDNLVSACLERNPKFRPELTEILPLLDGYITRRPRLWPDTFPVTPSREHPDTFRHIATHAEVGDALLPAAVAE